MSAIWGHVEFNSSTCSVRTMESEYKRKCKLDKINEVHLGGALFGHGQQFISNEDHLESFPYTTSDNSAIVTADCILDNREELIRQLGDGPDGKLITLAYEKWGYDFVLHIQGIFSVAIFVPAEKKLFLCTDRTSSRCLYYYANDCCATFSTLISPIKKIHSEISQNEMYIKDFALLPGLLPNISSNETPWNGIYMIEAGCSVTIENGHIQSSRYYEPQKIDLPKDINELKDIFLQTYKNAVNKTLRTNEGVAIALSGGFDSASVAAMAAPILNEQNKKLISFTYVPHYDVSGSYRNYEITDETFLVKELASLYPNIETNFTDNDGRSCWPYIDELIDVMEIPFKAFVNLPLLMEIYRTASNKGCKVFLNGQTGNSSVSFGDIDEAVYDLWRQKKYIAAFRYFSNFCKKAHLSRKKWFVPELKKLLSQGKDSISSQEELSETIINPFINKELLKDYSLVARNKSGMPFNADSKILRREQFKYEIYTLPALSYIGAMETKLGLHTGVVIRDATRDPDILNFCYSFPFEYFSYEGTPRYLIRGFMEDLLPHNILYPIFKTGIQSADWINRIAKENSQIINRFYNVLFDESELFDKNELKVFFSSVPSPEIAESQAYIAIFIAYILAQFIHNSSSKN